MKKLNLLAIFSLLYLSVVAQQTQPVDPQIDNDGFVSIFDGKNLEGWSYDPVYWSVEDETIVGVVTPETILKRNTFIIWQESQPADFELKMEYRVSAEGNSGINYRSSDVEDVPYALKGYQLDIDGEGRWTGQNYEERGREFLALRGSVVRLGSGENPNVIGSTGDRAKLFEEDVKKEEWNSVHVVARGNTLIHMINGKVMCVVVDDDVNGRTTEGKIGMQVHVGPPMKIEYRNIMLKTIE